MWPVTYAIGAAVVGVEEGEGDGLVEENEQVIDEASSWSYVDTAKAVTVHMRDELFQWYDKSRPGTGPGLLLCLSLLFWFGLWRRRAAKSLPPRRSGRASRPRLSSRDGLGNRPRLASHDKKSSSTRTRSSTEDLAPGSIFEDLAADWGENAVEANYEVLGPSVTFLCYEAWSPPTSWSEASRQILPQVAKHDIQRQVRLDLKSSKLNLGTTRAEKQEDENTNDRIIHLTDVSVHVKTPLEGGVLELNVKEPHKEEQWIEHTFTSAHMAAQFQQDMLGCQVVGRQVQNMFAALALVQSGSMASEETEYVLHDAQPPLPQEDEKKEEQQTSTNKEAADAKNATGVAWDDVMRCLSSLPSVRATLEKQHEYHTQVTLWGEEETKQPSSLSPLYEKKRLLLGPLDFFRLFVPALPSSSLPNNESNPVRMEQLLTWRKRAARASILVKSYVRAMKVVNQGWTLDRNVADGSAYLTRRVAFDDDNENTSHDSKHKNEYYEATVSRDVRCDVHTPQHLTKRGSSSPSPYQAYSLVGCHCFQLPPNGMGDHPLLHDKDPVRALPSLRRIIKSNPDVDFFVSGFFPEGPRIAMVLVFCRSLPKGIDKHFDTILDRYVNGKRKVRDRKMEVFMQLGPAAGLSPMAWAALKSLSALLSWTRRGEAEIPRESGTNVRTPFPGMTMGKYTETTHFGGCMQKDKSLPPNYIGVNAHVDGEKMSNMAARLLYQRLEDGALPASIVDFTFVLEGEEPDELPERALASVRMVHIDAVKLALPVSFSKVGSRHFDDLDTLMDLDDIPDSPVTPPASSPHRTSMWTSWTAFRSSFSVSRSRQSEEMQRARMDDLLDLDLPATVDVSTVEKPFREGVKALWEVLHGVTVPVRKESLSPKEARYASEVIPSFGMSAQLPTSVKREDLVNFPVLRKLTLQDLKRYYIASESDLKTAAVRIVESSAWRGVTFPIDTRVCRIELQSGQFFQQGRDRTDCPVFYFQNMCLGPWRKDVGAVISAVVHRLESCLNRLSKDEPDVKFTVVLLMGRPFQTVKNKKAEKKKDTSSHGNEESKDEDESASWNPFSVGVNPRIDPGEEYYTHTSPTLVSKLAQLLFQHYPERLSKLLVVPGKGGSGYFGMSVGGSLGLRAYVPSQRTRDKVSMLNSVEELSRHIKENQLCTFVGGTAPVSPDAFECSNV